MASGVLRADEIDSTALEAVTHDGFFYNPAIRTVTYPTEAANGIVAIVFMGQEVGVSARQGIATYEVSNVGVIGSQLDVNYFGGGLNGGSLSGCDLTWIAGNVWAITYGDKQASSSAGIVTVSINPTTGAITYIDDDTFASEDCHIGGLTRVYGNLFAVSYCPTADATDGRIRAVTISNAGAINATFGAVGSIAVSGLGTRHLSPLRHVTSNIFAFSEEATVYTLSINVSTGAVTAIDSKGDITGLSNDGFLGEQIPEPSGYDHIFPLAANEAGDVNIFTIPISDAGAISDRIDQTEINSTAGSAPVICRASGGYYIAFNEGGNNEDIASCEITNAGVITKKDSDEYATTAGERTAYEMAFLWHDAVNEYWYYAQAGQPDVKACVLWTAWISAPSEEAPTISAITPASGTVGDSELSVVITGDNFVGATGISFGSEITIDGWVVDSNTQITATITIPSDATVGTYDVTVTNLVGSATETDGFEIESGTEDHYVMDLENLNMHYLDSDLTEELHLSIENLSATSKSAGEDGEVTLEITYEVQS